VFEFDAGDRCPLIDQPLTSQPTQTSRPTQTRSSMNTHQTVLLAGATGMLGHRIAQHLLAQQGTSVRLLVRPGSMSDPDRQLALAPLVRAGAVVVEAALTDGEELERVCVGVDVVLSALAGGRDVIVEGQVALARAARAAGARRFFPSDFALDLFTMTPGVVSSYDARRAADEAIAATGIETVHVLCGAFLDMFANPRGALAIDEEDGTATYWGEGTEVFEATTIDDTARYTARAATDPDLPAGKFAVAGARLSFGDMVTAWEQLSGRTYRRVSRGSVADLEQAAARAREVNADSMAALIAGYQVAMLTGRAALRDLQNDRYPEIRPTGHLEFARLSGTVAA
jgi:nucleoside-diphosphate-sugar epimerase